MSLLSIDSFKVPCLTFIITITVFCWLIGGNTLSYAQEKSPVPTVKIKRKPKKPIQIRPNRRRQDIKDDYRQPKTKSTPQVAKDAYKAPRSRKKSGRVKEDYQRPASKSNSEKVKASEAKAPSSPTDEGYQSVKSTFWNRIIHGNTSSTYQGNMRIPRNAEGNTGSSYIGQKNKKIDFESLSRDIHAYEGGLKTRHAKQKASRAAMFEGRIKHAPQHRELRQYKQLAKSTGQYQGNIKVSPSQVQSRRQKATSGAISNSYGPLIYKRYSRKKQIRQNQQEAKQVGRYAGQIKVYKKQEKAEDYSFYRGHIKVRTSKNQTRHYKKLSDEIHQFNGMLRVRKAGKDMHPSVSYLKSKTKNSYEQKERYRKWNLKWHQWFKFKDQPKHLKTKSRKPRYDNKESEIWYY